MLESIGNARYDHFKNLCTLANFDLEGFNSRCQLFSKFHCKDTRGLVTSRKGVRSSFRSIRCIWQEILNFEISNFTCVFFHKWVTEGSNPGVNFFQNFQCEDTSGLLSSRKGVRPSFRSIRCIWQEILNVEFSHFTCVFFQKWVTVGSNPEVNFFSELLLYEYQWVTYIGKGCQTKFQINPIHMTRNIGF